MERHKIHLPSLSDHQVLLIKIVTLLFNLFFIITAFTGLAIIMLWIIYTISTYNAIR